MRVTGNGVRFALLGLVSQHADGIHGWALKSQCERFLGSFWQLNFGEIYRVLDRLAAEGLIGQTLAEAGSNKKVYRITEKGKRSLDDFILAPPTDAPRPLRQELAVKLLFAEPSRVPQLLELIAQQREIYMQQLGTLSIQRRKLRRLPVDGFVTGLLIDGAESQVRAELSWLDHVTHKLTERFSSAT
jgi:DNA-binding PadR family transcriptional regulator